MSTSSDTVVHFTAQTDQGFFIPTLVMATSARANMAPGSCYHFHLFHAPLEEWQITAARQLETDRFKISLYEVKEGRHTSFRQKNHVTPISLVRLELPERLPDLDKILYLDGDILVQQDLTGLYQTELGDHLIAAVADMMAGIFNPYTNELPGDTYVNSGVMLMNLRQMRMEGTVDKFFQTKATTPPHWIFQDQDVVNACCANRILRLHPRYNGLVTTFERVPDLRVEQYNQFYNTHYTSRQDVEQDCAIVHLAGTPGRRPWERADGVYSTQWQYYFMLSPVKQVNLNLRTPWEYCLPKPVRKYQYGLGRFLPIFTLRVSYNSEKNLLRKQLKLFGLIPLLWAEGSPSRLTWKLFNLLSVWQTSEKS